ncbi:MAG: hypothetical protein GTN76_03550 [Candidatus Aenigmarchaeota archaeon]|nr:hypothetical protein [Candidatus Aenigmarchaeota archaeon]
MMSQPQERNWWNRNWKWFVPVSCLVLLVGICAGIAYLGFGLVKSFETYKDAVAKAKTNSAVMEALGSPIKEGLLVAGNINVSGPSGQADLAIPISGPKGKATIHAVAKKSAGKWTFSTLEVAINASGERINILFTGTGASQNSNEKVIQELISKIYIGMIYPSGNVYLKSFNSSQKDQINWSRSVLIHPLPIEGKHKPPIENNFNKAVFIQKAENEYIPGLEGFDEDHNEPCGWEYEKLKSETDRYIPDFFRTVFDYCAYEEGVSQYKIDIKGLGPSHIVAFEDSLRPETQTLSIKGKKRPMSEEEKERVQELKKRDLTDCYTVPHFIDSAKQLLSIKFLNSEYEIRISSYRNAGCGGHLAHIYVLDLIKNKKVLDTYEVSHYYGPI